MALYRAMSMPAILLLTSCTGIAQDDSGPVDPSPAPRSISTLLSASDLTVFLRLSVNDTVLYEREITANGDIAVQVPNSALADTVSQLSVLFYIPAYGDNAEELPLASSRQTLLAGQDDSVAMLSGSQYQYADSDGDGVFNIHELTIEPRDLDSDTVDNVFDTDSDGDSSADGLDDLPYEGSTTNMSVIDLQQTLLLEFDDNTIALGVERILGDTQELILAANTLNSLPLRAPALWPAVAEDPDFVNRHWTAYGLKAGRQELCPDWTQSVGTSSIRSSVQGTVLLYFRRDDGTAFIAALEDNDIPDLDIFDNSVTGNGPFNDGLRMLLVPRGTAGWLDLFTDRDYQGRVCSLNVTSELPAMNQSRN